MKKRHPNPPLLPIGPSERHEPYSVEQYPASPGSVLLVGYDGRGEFMLELRMPEHRVGAETIQRLRRWMMDNDDAPQLRVVRDEDSR